MPYPFHQPSAMTNDLRASNGTLIASFQGTTISSLTADKEQFKSCRLFPFPRDYNTLIEIHGVCVANTERCYMFPGSRLMIWKDHSTGDWSVEWSKLDQNTVCQENAVLRICTNPNLVIRWKECFYVQGVPSDAIIYMHEYVWWCFNALYMQTQAFVEIQQIDAHLPIRPDMMPISFWSSQPIMERWIFRLHTAVGCIYRAFGLLW